MVMDESQRNFQSAQRRPSDRWRVGLAGAIIAVAGLAMGSPPAAHAAPLGPAPSLSLPIACAMNVDCWIVKYFDSDPPARQTIEVAKLPKKANVEISCIAVK